jgi:hypothetical protein
MRPLQLSKQQQQQQQQQQKQQDASNSSSGAPPLMAWRDGITLAEAQAALLLAVDALYEVPSGDQALARTEHLAALRRLHDGDGGEDTGARGPEAVVVAAAQAPTGTGHWAHGQGT